MQLCFECAVLPDISQVLQSSIQRLTIQGSLTIQADLRNLALNERLGSPTKLPFPQSDKDAIALN